MALVFGYGSLVPGADRPATLRGWRRMWGVAMENARDIRGYKHFEDPRTGERPDVFVAFVDVEPARDGEVNGALVVVEDDALAALDARERNYERRAVETEAGPAWTYVGSTDGRARLTRGVRERRCVVADQYLERIRAGFARLGAHELERFESTTPPPPGPVRPLVVIPHT
jgi:gamma-glutamylcyclotransferase (GGCT)/AIG2-like uncharacterized protein YtfP